jgi:hypothetical protein
MIITSQAVESKFNTNSSNIKKIFDPTKLSKIHYDEQGKIKLYDKDDNILLNAVFQEIGSYDTKTKIWVWSWNKFPVNNLMSKYSKTVKKSTEKLLQQLVSCKNSDTCKHIEEYYYFAKYGNLYYEDDIMKLIKYAMFITDAPWYLAVNNQLDPTVPNEKIHYLYITNIVNY